jgi:hypothetical protein
VVDANESAMDHDMDVIPHVPRFGIHNGGADDPDCRCGADNAAVGPVVIVVAYVRPRNLRA